MRSIQHQVQLASIQIAFLDERQLLRYFAAHGVHTKHEAACLLAREFPEVAWQLPPHPRKPWEPEHWRMPAFDALMLAVIYLGPRTSQSKIKDIA